MDTAFPQKMRPNKESRALSDSIQSESALARSSEAAIDFVFGVTALADPLRLARFGRSGLALSRTKLIGELFAAREAHPPNKVHGLADSRGRPIATRAAPQKI